MLPNVRLRSSNSWWWATCAQTALTPMKRGWPQRRHSNCRHRAIGRPHDTAFILYASGSTANPKVVPNIHGAVVENGFHIGERQDLTPIDRVMLPAPLFWSYGAANAMCATFSHGATLVLQGRFEPGPALTPRVRHFCPIF